MKVNIVYATDQTGTHPVSVTIFHQGRPFVASNQHPNFTAIIDALEQQRSTEEVVDMFDNASALARGFKNARRMLQSLLGKQGEGDATAEIVHLFDADIDDADDDDADVPGPALQDDEDALRDDFDTKVRGYLDQQTQEADSNIELGVVQTPVSTPDTDDLDTLNQRELQALAKQMNLGNIVGARNDEVREMIRSARNQALRDDLDTLNQRELQSLASQYNIPSVGKTNAWLRDQIRRKQGTHLLDVADKLAIDVEGNLFFDGEPVHGAIADTIMAYHRQGNRNLLPLMRFLAKLLENPNPHSREHLYEWMGHLSFNIAEDGDIIAYKGVQKRDDGDYVSCHSHGTAKVNGTWHKDTAIPNPIGGIVEMDREKVTFDPRVGCSHGLHVGTVNFASGYGNALLELKINPRDVVSVPSENLWQKLRVCRYEVVRECTAREARELNQRPTLASIA